MLVFSIIIVDDILSTAVIDHSLKVKTYYEAYHGE